MDVSCSPIAFACTLLLDTLGIGVYMASFGKVSWKAIFRNSGTVGKTSVISIVVLDGASH